MTAGLSDRLRKVAARRWLLPVSPSPRFQLSGSLGLRINTSPSLPMGLYITTADAGANLVEFCPVERSQHSPSCAAIVILEPAVTVQLPLLKPIVAQIRRCRRSIRTRNLGEWSTPAEHGSAHEGYKGRHLEAWPSGRYIVYPGTVWVASSYYRAASTVATLARCRLRRFRHRLKAFLTLMNVRSRDRLSFCLAIAIGFAVSTGHPLGIIAAAGMPLVCLTPGSRRAAFESTVGYYLAAIWPMVPGLNRYFRQSAISLIPVAVWVLAAILLSVPWTIAWTSSRSHCLWRVPLALFVTIVPPLGIVGLASPVTASGYLFPERLGSASSRSRSCRDCSLDARFAFAPTLRCFMSR